MAARIIDMPVHGGVEVVEHREPEGGGVVAAGVVGGAAGEKNVKAAISVGTSVVDRVLDDRLEHLASLKPAVDGTSGIGKAGAGRLIQQGPSRPQRRRTAHPLIGSGRRGIRSVKVPGSEAGAAVLAGRP